MWVRDPEINCSFFLHFDTIKSLYLLKNYHLFVDNPIQMDILRNSYSFPWQYLGSSGKSMEGKHSPPPLTHAIDILGLVPILCRQYVKQSNDRSMYKVREGGEGVKLNMYFQPCKPWMLIILMDIYACMMKNINMMFYKHLQTGILPYLHDTNCVKKTFLKSDS